MFSSTPTCIFFFDVEIVRWVKIFFLKEKMANKISILPTHNCCLAMDMISMNIRLKMMEDGYANIKFTSVLFPA